MHSSALQGTCALLHTSAPELQTAGLLLLRRMMVVHVWARVQAAVQGVVSNALLMMLCPCGLPWWRGPFYACEYASWCIVLLHIVQPLVTNWQLVSVVARSPAGPLTSALMKVMFVTREDGSLWKSSWINQLPLG